MGTLTTAQFITNLTLELGNRGDITTYDDMWINAAYYWLTSRRDLYFPELDFTAAASVNTADGTAYVDTTAVMLYVQGVYDTTSTRWLRKITPKQYFQYTDRADTSAEAAPSEWTHTAGGSYRGYIYLHPTPDTTYALIRYYRALPTALTGTAVTAIGTEWDEVILRAAVWLASIKLRESSDNIKRHKDALDTLIAGLKGLYDMENISLQEGVKPHPAYHG